MSNKVLRWLIYGAGIFCFYIFLSIRILPLFNAILLEKYIPEYWENTKYGELYYMNYIKYFREEGLPQYKIKYRFTDKHPKLSEADILLFGDSYFDFSRMTTFPEQLSDSLNERAFYARNSYPLEYLKKNNYSNNEKKFLIYESAERFLPSRFEKPHTIGAGATAENPFRKAFSDFEEFIFPDDAENNYSMLLSRSYFTTHIYSAIATLKFDLFRQINSQTPAYSLDHDRPWLFGGGWYGDGPERYSYKYSDEEMANFCDNILQLKNDVKEQYNLDLVFLIIPSKYTIYHHLLNVPDSAYSNYIPEMYSEMKKRGIPVIEIYQDFMAERDNILLYYGTDTHWTQEGLQITLHNTLTVLDSLQFRSYQADNTTNLTKEIQSN